MSTTWTQEAGLTGQVDTDNLQDIVDQAQAHATDSENSATASANSATSSASSATSASTSATNAANSASSASTSATSASTSAINASNSATAASTSATNAATSATAAAGSATSADTSATNAAASESSVAANATAAATSETNAASSATSAATSATAAATSATSSASSATASAGSATAASASETAAANSETNAANSATSAGASATSAAGSATAASNSATAAAGSATAAASSASAASVSESNAATSETNASTSETNAANSASAASASETNASASASSASTSASSASTSATNAATSASQAATSASNASASETNAATSATTATTKASEASTSATNAATSESNAANSASAAASSASSASASADAALAALDSFDDRYLGQKASDPSLDNDGNALVAGALYFNTTDDVMKVYEGSVWVAAYASLSGALLQANNLSDVQSVTAARTNLGLGTAATTASTDYATAAQGALADSALQSFTETDPVFTAWDKSTGISITESQISDFGSYQPSGSYEPAFTKNTAFNKNFGTTTGTVAQGNDSRIDNGQTAYGWGNHASAGYQSASTALTTSTTFGGDVSGTYNAIVIADDSHNHVISNVDGLQTALDGKSATSHNHTLDSLSNTTITSVASGEILKWNGTAWINNTLAEAGIQPAGSYLTGNQTITLSGDASGSGTTSIAVTVANDSHSHSTSTITGLGSLATLSAVGADQITDNSVGAAELNVSGNGTTSQYLRSDGDGTFTWATPTDTNTTYTAGTGMSLSGTTFNCTITNNNQLTNGAGYVTSSGVTSVATSGGLTGGTITSTGTVSISSDARPNSNQYFGGSGGEYFYFDGSNNLVRGYVNSGEVMRLYSGTTGVHFDGDVIAYSTTISDERLKEDIVGIDNALDKVSKLGGYTFKYKADGKVSAGVIAQQVEAVLPEAVCEKELGLHTNDDGNTYKVVNYDALHGLLIEAIKELKSEIAELKEQING